MVDDPAEPLNAPVDDPTGQQATDPANASMRGAPGRVTYAKPAWRETPRQRSRWTPRTVKASELTCTLVNAHFVAVRRDGRHAARRRCARDESSGGRARQRPVVVCSRRASAGGVTVAEGGQVVSGRLRCRGGSGERLRSRETSGWTHRVDHEGFRTGVHIGGRAPAPDCLRPISLRSLAAVRLLFGSARLTHGDRRAPTSCSQILALRCPRPESPGSASTGE